MEVFQWFDQFWSGIYNFEHSGASFCFWKLFNCQHGYQRNYGSCNWCSTWINWEGTIGELAKGYIFENENLN